MARSMARPHAKLSAVALAAALALSACGEDPARAKRGQLTLTLVDYRISPQDVVARPGGTTIEIRNDGRLPHNLKVMAGEGTMIGFDTIKPGERARKFRRLRRGTYKFVCTVGNHEDLGMFGSLTVR